MQPKKTYPVFAERLSKAMQDADLDTKELSRLSGVTRSSFYHYLDGRFIPKYPTVRQIAKTLKVNPNWLIGISDDPTPQPDLSMIDNLEQPDLAQIPLIGQIACGEPILADENIESHVPAPIELKDCFALRCKGDSMINARIMDGDLVFVRPQIEVENGEIAAIRIDTEATLKRFYKIGDTIILRPENPQYPDQIYTATQFLDVQIIGKAVGFYSSLDTKKAR